MKRLLTALVIALASAFGWSQSSPISGQVINTSGQPLPNSTVRVCAVTSSGTPCTPLATIYSDYSLTQQATNPYPADQYGNYLFYVPALATPNAYLVQITPAAGVTWSYVFNGPSVSISGGSLTGALTDTFGFIGPLTGNVTGNVTGTVTGHATLDLPLTGGTLSGALNGTTAAFFSLSGTGTATFTLGAGAGTTPGTPTCSGICDSMHGTVIFTTGTAPPSTGTLLTIQTGTTYMAIPLCVGQLRLSASPNTLTDTRLTYTTTPAQIIFNLTGTALSASTAYVATYTGCVGS